MCACVRVCVPCACVLRRVCAHLKLQTIKMRAFSASCRTFHRSLASVRTVGVRRLPVLTRAATPRVGCIVGTSSGLAARRSMATVSIDLWDTKLEDVVSAQQHLVLDTEGWVRSKTSTYTGDAGMVAGCVWSCWVTCHPDQHEWGCYVCCVGVCACYRLLGRTY